MWNGALCSPGQDKKRASVIYDQDRKKEEKIWASCRELEYMRLGVVETSKIDLLSQKHF